MSLPLMARMNHWPSKNSCLETTFWKQHWTFILHGQLQPHQTRSWDSFLAQLMVMKLVQFIVPIVVIVAATVVALVLACPTVRVQISCGPWILTNQRHMMAQGPCATQSSKTTDNA